jgi:hypothetical protein
MKQALLLSLIVSVTSVYAEFVPVSASNKEAVRLGKYESGKAITVEYKSGVWNQSVRIARYDKMGSTEDHHFF